MTKEMLHQLRWNRNAKKLERAESWLASAMCSNPTRHRRAIGLVYGYELWLLENGPDGLAISVYQ